MNLSASYTFDAPPQVVWDLLNDPAVIADCLPGCQSLVPTGEHSYRASLTVSVAAISGRFEGTVTLLDQHEPSSYRLVVDGSGRAGFVKGEAEVALTAAGMTDGQTLVSVDGRAQVGGTVARVGQRLLTGVSKMMVDRFFDCLGQKAASALESP